MDGNRPILIIGAGSTGSFIALTLAKMGIEDMTIIDYDELEEKNIPNQFYKIKDTGEKKVHALRDIIKDFSNIEIKISQEKITSESDIGTYLQHDSIIIICTDNIESRKIIFEQIKHSNIEVIDTRMGGEEYTIHYYQGTNKESIKDYEKLLKQTITETTCGEKGIIYTILAIASDTTNMIKKIIKKEKIPIMIRRTMKNNRMMEKEVLKNREKT